ncbi:GNAT family protein [Pseudomonas sp. WS 5011]|uniref:GNAT family N-acetyltransferase n=1 Tax=Pseudomonas sp. WS 5011 TaxID=2717477 RepID=UPI0014761AC2|nr:GNAT family protein [Pseudomonas sp. WS 5011]NMY52318.1 GNAT family N-acetyltransferase [Pseudomonas sp. WS 5011]
MIGGKAVVLRSWKEADVPLLRDMRNDVLLQAQLLARPRGSDESQVRDWLRAFTAVSGDFIFILADPSDDTVLGFLQFRNTDFVSGNTELGICLASSAQGRGVGSEVIELARVYMRDTWGMKKFWLKVRSDNLAAIKCYEKVGFSHCGRLSNHVFISGDWHDVAFMELFLS